MYVVRFSVFASAVSSAAHLRCAGAQPAQRYLDAQRSAISTSSAAQFMQQSPHKIQTKFQLYLQMISFKSPIFLCY